MAKGKVNVKLLKKNLTLPMHKLVLKAIDIPIFSESDREWRCYSGDKYKNALEGKVKLYFYPDSGLYVGYNSARTYDLIGLVQQRLKVLGKNCSFMDAINLILSVTGLDPDAVQRINTNPNVYNWEEKLEKYLRVKRGESVLPVYDPSILDQLSKKIPQEWLDEGISEETMEKYQIRYYDRLNQICIPCFTETGSLCGIRVRNMRPELIEQAKYLPLYLLDGTNYKFNTNNIFYGISFNKPYIEQCGEVILVESEKAVMQADGWLHEKSNVLALYGSQIGSLRRNQLIKMGVSKVVLALDSDFHEADESDPEFVEFQNKMLNLAKLFRNYAEVSVVYNNIGLDAYKCSPFDFDKETWQELYNNREIIDWKKIKYLDK